MTWDDVVAIALQMPSVEIGSYHGYPALRVTGKFLTRLGDDHSSLEFKGVGFDECEMLIASAPTTFFVPESQKGASVFARLSKLNKSTLRGLLERRWRVIAPKALVKDLEQSKTRRQSSRDHRRN